MKNTKLINDLIMYAAMNNFEDEAQAMREAATIIREMQEELMRKWIPVTEQLPKPYERVIVAREFEPENPMKVEQGMLTEGGWWKVYGTNVRRGVLFWMPMPAALEVDPGT